MYYSEMSDAELLLLMDSHPEGIMRCEYRSPEWDGGSQQGRMIRCTNKAAMWTDRGLRCEDHRRD